MTFTWSKWKRQPVQRQYSQAQRLLVSYKTPRPATKTWIHHPLSPFPPTLHGSNSRFLDSHTWIVCTLNSRAGKNGRTPSRTCFFFSHECTLDRYPGRYAFSLRQIARAEPGWLEQLETIRRRKVEVLEVQGLILQRLPAGEYIRIVCFALGSTIIPAGEGPMWLSDGDVGFGSTAV